MFPALKFPGFVFAVLCDWINKKLVQHVLINFLNHSRARPGLIVTYVRFPALDTGYVRIPAFGTGYVRFPALGPGYVRFPALGTGSVKCLKL